MGVGDTSSAWVVFQFWMVPGARLEGLIFGVSSRLTTHLVHSWKHAPSVLLVLDGKGGGLVGGAVG